MVENLTEKIRRLPFGWSPSALATVDVIAEMHEEADPEELKGYWVDPLGGFVELEREGEPNLLTTHAVNFEFMCDREYVEGDEDEEPERIEDPNVVLQVAYEPEQGYECCVFLRGNGLPDPETRRAVLLSGILTHYAPRREDRYSLDEDIGIASLETGWYESEDDFKSAVREALEMFVLRGWRGIT